jgi:SAM-dependent methyltransferase
MPLPDAWSLVASEYARNIVPGFRPAATALCAMSGIQAGDRVLDIACGPGTAALVAWEIGARPVVGVDFSIGMLARAREAAAGLDGIEFVEGNALALPLPDASFDVVISNFGVIFAPDPSLAVTEMARVLATGGRIGFTAWLRSGTTDSYYRTVSRHLPEIVSPHDAFDWGDPEIATRWLGTRFQQVHTETIEVPFTARNAQEAWHALRSSTGRVGATYPRLSAEARLSMDGDMEAYFGQYRQPDGTTRWIREALVIVGKKKSADEM